MRKSESKSLVSIGIPTYNRPAELESILKIITNQTYSDLEIIVSDNSSPDESVIEVIKKFSSLDSRIKYYRQEKNIGVLANFEYVLENSTGEYFAWVSDDDWRSPQFIEELLKLLRDNPFSDLAFCDYHEINEDGSIATDYPFSHLSLFKPFQSKYRLIRTLSHFWQNQQNGKCNLFYGLFRRSVFSKIDFKKTSLNYNYLGLDNQIVFQILQSGPIAISPNSMCCLTCKNTKYYNEHLIYKINKNIFFKFGDLVQSYLNDLKMYLINSSSFIEKLLIVTLLFPKILKEISYRKFKNIIFNVKKNICNQFKRKFFVEVPKSDNSFSKKLQLPNVTLVIVDTRQPELALQALLYSSRDIDFGRIKLLSNYSPYCRNELVQIHPIPIFNNIDEWCFFIVYELYKYIDTEFIMLIHVDGFVVNPSEWRSQFLDYDYIGSPWPLPKDDFSYRDINGNIIRVGNSVSIRSKKLLEMPSKLKIPWVADHGYFNEDGFLCCANRHILQENGIKYAPIEIAKYFAHESMIPEIKGIKPFAFHKWKGSNSKYPKLKRNQYI